MKYLLLIGLSASVLASSPIDRYVPDGYYGSDSHKLDLVLDYLVELEKHIYSLEEKMDILADHLTYIYSTKGYPDLLQRHFLYDDKDGIHFVPPYFPHFMLQDLNE